MEQVAKKLMHNFNSGPSVLPKEVFEQAAQGILDFNNTGLSILEIGHRTELFYAVMDEARALVKELMQLDNDREVLFLHGGATTQFFQVPMNLLNENETASYLDCGTWGSKAIKEAKLYGNVNMVASSKDKGYTYIPKGYSIPAESVYFHYTTNNTIEGTQMHAIPGLENSNSSQELVIPSNSEGSCKKATPFLISDMSSDILSRVMDFNRFDLIYAGAQKNIGAAGVNLVIVNKNILGRVNRPLPGMMDYRQHAEAGSLLNTPPVFAIYVCLLTLRWLKQQGGVSAIEKINDEKAALVYDTLDSLPVFRPTVAKEDRSKMNVVWVMDDKDAEKEFLQLCKQEGMVGVKGHRSVGGFRASLYNALSMESVQALVSLMKHFAQTKG